MSMPPQPGPWGSQQSPGPQQPPPGYYGQPAWGPPQPPPSKGNAVKWLLIAVALLLVIAIAVGVTLFVTRDGGGGSTNTSTAYTAGGPGDIASVNDTGPVEIVTTEPTCQAFGTIAAGLISVQRNGWTERDNSAPASEWTPAQRAQTEAVGTSMRNAADQTVPLARQTPNRVVRELYEQFIAYGRAYADSIPTYTPADDFLAGVNISAGNALASICDAITYGSAVTRSIAVGSVAPPTDTARPEPAEPERFVMAADSTCVAWVQREDRFIADTNVWTRLNPNELPAQWTPDHLATQERTMPIFKAYADAIEEAGRQSGNPILEDFTVLSALYYRAYTTSIADYVAADNYLFNSAMRLSNLISSACRATAG